MSTFSIQIEQLVGSYNGIVMIMIDVIITNDTERFYEGALPYETTARDASTSVKSFKASLTPNRKQLHANFTTDAFVAFPGLFNIDFGLIGEVLSTFENIDITTALIPLDPGSAALGLPNADNAWLATI